MIILSPKVIPRAKTMLWETTGTIEENLTLKVPLKNEDKIKYLVQIIQQVNWDSKP